MSEGRDFVEAGGLMSYAANNAESFKRAAYTYCISRCNFFGGKQLQVL
jgi:hypothetical protein